MRNKEFSDLLNYNRNTLKNELKKKEHQYYKEKLRPYSMVIINNSNYSIIRRNCMHMSSFGLMYGTLKNKSKRANFRNITYNLYSRLKIQILFNTFSVDIPNFAYKLMRMLNFGKEYTMKQKESDK